MRVSTIGAELLKGRFLNKSDVARRVGVSHQVVSQWVAGEKRPDPERRALIEKEFGIPADAWLEPEERTDERHEFAAVVSEYLRRLQAEATEFLASIARKTL